MNTCDQCGRILPQGVGIVDVQGTFCDKQCFDGEVLSVEAQRQQFDGWDEGLPIGCADLISKRHDGIFSIWERTARKEL